MTLQLKPLSLDLDKMEAAISERTNPFDYHEEEEVDKALAAFTNPQLTQLLEQVNEQLDAIELEQTAMAITQDHLERNLKNRSSS